MNINPKQSSFYKQIYDLFNYNPRQLNTLGSTSLYHADFAPHNILYAHDKINIIDFFAARRGHALMDLVNYIASVPSRAENFLYPHASVKKFCSRFLASYGQVPIPDSILPPLLLLLHSVKRLLVVTQHAATGILPSVIPCRAQRQHMRYLENYRREDFNALHADLWPFLDLSNLGQSITTAESSPVN